MHGTCEGAFLEQPEGPLQAPHSTRLFSIPEVAEEDAEPREFLRRKGSGCSSGTCEPRPARPCRGHGAPQGSWFPAKPRGPTAGPCTEDVLLEGRGCRLSRSATRSPDSGLDCGSEDEDLRWSSRSLGATSSPGPGPCPCRSLRPLLARRRTLTRQTSIEEDFGEQVDPSALVRSHDTRPSPERPAPRTSGWDQPTGQDVWKKSLRSPPSGATARHAQAPPRAAEGPVVCAVSPPPLRLPDQSVRCPPSHPWPRRPGLSLAACSPVPFRSPGPSLPDLPAALKIS